MTPSPSSYNNNNSVTLDAEGPRSPFGAFTPQYVDAPMTFSPSATTDSGVTLKAESPNGPFEAWPPQYVDPNDLNFTEGVDDGGSIRNETDSPNPLTDAVDSPADTLLVDPKQEDQNEATLDDQLQHTPEPLELRDQNSGPERSGRLVRQTVQAAGKYGNKEIGTAWKYDGQLVWENTGEADGIRGELFVAVYHHDIRRELVAEDARKYAAYIEQPMCGDDDFDVTSNCDVLNQHLWQFDTLDQLSHIRDRAGNRVFLPGGMPEREGPVIDEYMYYHGRLVLDLNNNPILDIPGIPRCFSSQVEGGRLEAIQRAMPWITTKDILVRQPRVFNLNGKERGAIGLTAIRHRQSRFRDKMLISPRVERRGTAAKLKRYAEAKQLQ